MFYFHFSDISISVLLQNKMLFAKDIKFWHRRVQRGGQGVLTPPFPGLPLFICDPRSHPTRSHRQM